MIMRKALFSLVAAALLAPAAGAFAADGDVRLPEPEKSGGMPVLEAIAKRQSVRDFADEAVTPQQLSTLLWATAGVNREDGKLTYATAMNAQDIIVFVFTREGVYRYEPKEHSLTLIEKGDHRAATGKQDFVARAAVDLVFVQDTERWKSTPAWGKITDAAISECGFAHIGSMTQSAYLYAAAQGWGARTRMSFDQAALSKLLKLTPTQSPKLMQCVGPKAQGQ